MLEKATMMTPAEVDRAEKSTEIRGLRFQRYYTKPGVHPFDEVEWELRTATISNEKGEKVFEQKDVEIPKSWSMTYWMRGSNCEAAPASNPICDKSLSFIPTLE